MLERSKFTVIQNVLILPFVIHCDSKCHEIIFISICKTFSAVSWGEKSRISAYNKFKVIDVSLVTLVCDYCFSGSFYSIFLI